MYSVFRRHERILHDSRYNPLGSAKSEIPPTNQYLEAVMVQIFRCSTVTAVVETFLGFSSADSSMRLAPLAPHRNQ
jgi:hypothetical protein